MEKQRYASYSKTLATGEHWPLPAYGRWITILYNSISINPEISIDSGGSFYPIPAGVSVKTLAAFSKIEFRNPAAVSMTLWVAFSDGEIYDNRMILAAVAAGLFLPIDDTSNGTVSDASIVVQPRAGFLLNAGPAVNVGGGVVGLPITGHPFSTGQGVTVTGAPQYNGAYTVLAGGGVNQVNITATFKGGLINNAAAVDKGGGKVGVPITGHPYATGETITIANAHANYNGNKVVDATSTVNEVVITATYAAYTFDGVDDSHNLTFDGVNDTIALTAAQSIPANATQKELHITNCDDTYKVFWGDSAVNATTYRGVPIAPESVYIIPCTDVIYLACEAGAGVTGCRVSWNRKTKS